MQYLEVNLFMINEKVYGCGKFNIGSTWYKLVKDNSI